MDRISYPYRKLCRSIYKIKEMIKTTLIYFILDKCIDRLEQMIVYNLTAPEKRKIMSLRNSVIINTIDFFADDEWWDTFEKMHKKSIKSNEPLYIISNNN
jgi:hypothetical protein